MDTNNTPASTSISCVNPLTNNAIVKRRNVTIITIKSIVDKYFLIRFVNLFIINSFQLFNLAIIKSDNAKVVLTSLIVNYSKTTNQALIAYKDKNNLAKLTSFSLKIRSPNTTINYQKICISGIH